jgi:iduronate 2-sulfatase
MYAYSGKRVILCLVVLVIFIGTTPTRARWKQSRPNVLLIFVDDLRTTLGAYGDPIAKTPNIDRLASTGATFTRAYCQYPLCNPSRTSCLSGKRPATTKVVDNGTNPRTLLPGEVFLPEYFKAQDYFTARVGKIEHADWPNIVRWDVAEDGPDSIDEVSHQTRNMPGWKASEFADELLPDGANARRALQLLRQYAEGTFFLGVGFRRPHRPLLAPKKYFELYNLDQMPLPEDALVDDGFTLEEKREVVRAYYACASYIDAQVGLLLDELDRLNLRQNTIIVLISDHGVDLGERDHFVRKQSLHEHVLRVPLILSGPGVPYGATLNQLVEMVDLYPTLSEMCGLPPPSGMEGLSFVPVLQNPARAWKSAAFSDNDTIENPSHSIRTDQYRYTLTADGRESLYELGLSAKETVDLAPLREHRKLLKQMRKLLRKGWRAALPALE